MKMRRISHVAVSLCFAAVSGATLAQELVSKANCPNGTWVQTGMQGRTPIGTCTVAEQAPAVPKCSAAPVVDAQSPSPTPITVKSGDVISVSVAGTIKNGAGCSLRSAEFRLDDEYGQINSSSTFSVGSDGQFAFSVPVQASRRGDDLDGRTYTITVTASNEVGSGSSAPIVSTVAHDNRETKGK